MTSYPQDESGATAIEYVLICALIGVALIAALGNFQSDLSKEFNEVGDKVDTAGD